MGIEIERRFLVKNEDWKSQVIFKENFSQAYLNSSFDKWATRIRIIDNNKAYITLKCSINSLVKNEFEYTIPLKDANELIKFSEYKIIKTRFHLKIGNRNWVVDIFDGSNFSLEIAEIELNSECEEIHIPSWCGKEITGIKSLSNASLAIKPISQFSLKERIKSRCE